MPWPSMKATMSSFTVVRSSGVGDIRENPLSQHCMPSASKVPARRAANLSIEMRVMREAPSHNPMQESKASDRSVRPTRPDSPAVLHFEITYQHPCTQASDRHMLFPKEYVG